MSRTAQGHRSTIEMVQLDDLRVSVRRAGAGSPVLLLHGFPHTKEIWREVEPLLVAAGYDVLMPDLRGTGDTERTAGGYDAVSLATDQVRLLDALSLQTAHVVGFDVGAAPAFALSAAHPDRVLSLTVVEAVISGLAGAETFLGSGGPWWFGFHQAPDGLAESLLSGDEDRYVRFFLGIGSRAGVPEDLARHFVRAYTGRDRLRAAFEHYRAMPANVQWNRSWAEQGRLTMPVTAVGASTVGDAPARQLTLIADHLDQHLLPHSGHLVPVDAPGDLASIVAATAARATPARA
ncbi:alpha/beta fold hydrolase [Micromonospora sp. WMMD714]|uniref:alpha/beta fold hydrolase n=1 Tax=Micromonospora sp. WMMD714 TaxID=3016097 RepID=UPI00249A6D63|nr:alpha/beta fold hydrolase [Micromonospora sp. WMMD714]WFE66754.1 alpha/beta fold hydrolase [Micromonospora sp. WMMD714]